MSTPSRYLLSTETLKDSTILVWNRATLGTLGARYPRLLENAQQRFHRVESILRVLGPEATLRRGYSITTDAAGNVVQTITAVRPGSRIKTRVADGTFGSEVTAQTIADS